jgi:hypothetical protein
MAHRKNKNTNAEHRETHQQQQKAPMSEIIAISTTTA